MQCSATPFVGRTADNITAAQVQAVFDAGTNNSTTYTPSLTSLFINGPTEAALTATDPKTLDAFFDTTTYVGAVRDANDSWYAGWTCNSTSATFDNASATNRACESLPVS
jgi:hypothetical protein